MADHRPLMITTELVLLGQRAADDGRQNSSLRLVFDSVSPWNRDFTSHFPQNISISRSEILVTLKGDKSFSW